MIRAAAKNHQDVLVITNPSQYSNLIDAYKSNSITNELRKNYSQQAFEHTAIYDLTISKWIANKIPARKGPWLQSLPLIKNLGMEKIRIKMPHGSENQRKVGVELMNYKEKN